MKRTILTLSLIVFVVLFINVINKTTTVEKIEVDSQQLGTSILTGEKILVVAGQYPRCIPAARIKNIDLLKSEKTAVLLIRTNVLGGRTYELTKGE